ncbi:MAG: AzlD domain-containing protein [Gammaproteobacteria bacterium]|nr:AzlD domain-containing protein [Gammaproteobacteria bacterium]
MNPSNRIYLAIALMSLVIYSLRIGGFYLAGRIKFSPKLKAWLDSLPGCLLMAIIAPNLIHAPISHWLAALIIIVVMHKTQQLFLSLVIGLGFLIIYPYLP